MQKSGATSQMANNKNGLFYLPFIAKENSV